VDDARHRRLGFVSAHAVNEIIVPVTTATNDATVMRSAGLVPPVLAVIAAGLLVVSLLSAFISVHVPRVGDSSSYRCSPIRTAIGGDEPTSSPCSPHVQGRLGVATLAGVGAGAFGLLAFGVEVAFRRAENAGDPLDED
jgi:hypothetical protein